MVFPEHSVHVLLRPKSPQRIGRGVGVRVRTCGLKRRLNIVPFDDGRMGTRTRRTRRSTSGARQPQRTTMRRLMSGMMMPTLATSASAYQSR